MGMRRSPRLALVFIRNYRCCRIFGVSPGEIIKRTPPPPREPACPGCGPVSQPLPGLGVHSTAPALPATARSRGLKPALGPRSGLAGALPLLGDGRASGRAAAARVKATTSGLAACFPAPGFQEGCFFPAIKSAKRNVGPGAEESLLERLPK